MDTASEDYMGESGCVQNNFHLQHLSGKKEKQHLDLKLGWVGGWVGECDMRLDIPLEGDCSGATCDTERWPNTTN